MPRRKTKTFKREYNKINLCPSGLKRQNVSLIFNSADKIYNRKYHWCGEKIGAERF